MTTPWDFHVPTGYIARTSALFPKACKRLLDSTLIDHLKDIKLRGSFFEESRISITGGVLYVIIEFYGDN